MRWVNLLQTPLIPPAAHIPRLSGRSRPAGTVDELRVRIPFGEHVRNRVGDTASCSHVAEAAGSVRSSLRRLLQLEFYCGRLHLLPRSPCWRQGATRCNQRAQDARVGKRSLKTFFAAGHVYDYLRTAVRYGVQAGLGIFWAKVFAKAKV